jgi:hypothetical protein
MICLSRYTALGWMKEIVSVDARLGLDQPGPLQPRMPVMAAIQHARRAFAEAMAKRNRIGARAEWPRPRGRRRLGKTMRRVYCARSQVGGFYEGCVRADWQPIWTGVRRSVAGEHGRHGG